MSHYGIAATHWNVDRGEIDEVKLYKIVQQGQGGFALSHGELAWCSEVAAFIDDGATVWVIVTDGSGKYRNTDRVRVDTRDGGRQCRTKEGARTNALLELPRYIRPDDPLSTAARELLAKASKNRSDYPLLTHRLQDFGGTNRTVARDAEKGVRPCWLAKTTGRLSRPRQWRLRVVGAHRPKNRRYLIAPPDKTTNDVILWRWLWGPAQ